MPLPLCAATALNVSENIYRRRHHRHHCTCCGKNLDRRILPNGYRDHIVWVFNKGKNYFNNIYFRSNGRLAQHARGPIDESPPSEMGRNGGLLAIPTMRQISVHI